MLGKASLPMLGSERRAPEPRLRVLHVASRATAIGGHTRMLLRWIRHDIENIHSVALTRQHEQIPLALCAAVAATGGRVRHINRRVSGLLGWARSLQAALAEADLAVLHVDCQDVIPFLALAGMRRTPPVVLLNHADHMFWLGVDFADLVVSTRRSGHLLCARRRHVTSERNALLPLCLEPVTRQVDRQAAKLALGLPGDSIVLLTVARALKYRPVGSFSFADIFLPLLRADKRLRLVAVGPGGAVDWSVAEAAVPGQILAFRQQPYTQGFFEAADLYVDSFPFPSNTSLLEAGLHGLPLVTYYPFGDGCEIMGADSLGFDPEIVRAQNVTDFQRDVRLLAEDAKLRAEVGSRTMASIEAVNTGEGWSHALSRVYEQALELPRRVADSTIVEAPCFDDIDVFWPFVFGTELQGPPATTRLTTAREICLKTLPPARRLQAWAGMAWRQEFSRPLSKAWRSLLPEWLTVSIRDLIRRRGARMASFGDR
jgi:hypothetical protein